MFPKTVTTLPLPVRGLFTPILLYCSNHPPFLNSFPFLYSPRFVAVKWGSPSEDGNLFWLNYTHHHLGGKVLVCLTPDYIRKKKKHDLTVPCGFLHLSNYLIYTYNHNLCVCVCVGVVCVSVCMCDNYFSQTKLDSFLNSIKASMPHCTTGCYLGLCTQVYFGIKYQT